MIDDVDDPPLWSAREDLNPRDLANALEHIRRTAWAHWFGDAFEPQHMHAISAVAAAALCGEPIGPPVDVASPRWREMIRERHGEWMAMCDKDLIEQAHYQADEAADDCERCAGGLCSECGECPGQLCRDCRCDRRDQDDAAEGDRDDD